MRIGVVITMYDEYDLVITTIQNIRNVFNDVKIIVVQSAHEGPVDKMQELAEVIILPNLANDYHRTELPSQAICRNISAGCSALAGEFDVVVILTGDTLIVDAGCIIRRYNEMINNSWMGMVSQAWGHGFHAATDDPPNGIVGNRFQNPHTTDFACCFFIISGELFSKKAFHDIKITNRWTSEQCLGDEMLRVIDGEFHEHIGILNYQNPYEAYSYNDGITYHAKTGSPSR